MSNSLQNIPTPSAAEVDKYVNNWKSLTNYIEQEKCLDKLFKQMFPNNTDLQEILIKCSTLNSFYSTNIYSIFLMARHIQNLNIDNDLKTGNYDLVNKIANLNIKGKAFKFYAFATKYCSHHNPLKFPIYDHYVGKALSYYLKKDKFCKFACKDLKDYDKFVNIINEFIKYYGLSAYSIKQIDQYLWQLGKAYFPKKY